jgi:hypothetical protein
VEQDACVSSPNLLQLATNFHVPFWCGERLQPYFGPLLQLAGADACSCIMKEHLQASLHYSTMRETGRMCVTQFAAASIACTNLNIISHFGVVNDSALFRAIVADCRV